MLSRVWSGCCLLGTPVCSQYYNSAPHLFHDERERGNSVPYSLCSPSFSLLFLLPCNTPLTILSLTHTHQHYWCTDCHSVQSVMMDLSAGMRLSCVALPQCKKRNILSVTYCNIMPADPIAMSVRSIEATSTGYNSDFFSSIKSACTMNVRQSHPNYWTNKPLS